MEASSTGRAGPSLPALTRLEAWTRRQLDQGSIAGAQVHLRLGGEAADLVVGLGRADQELTAESLVPWFSAGKPVTAIALARLAEEGRISLDTPVAQWLAPFRAPVHDSVTLRHLLSHTSGIRDPQWLPSGPHADVVAATALDANRHPWLPGHGCGYSVYSEWYVLSAVLEAVTGDPLGVVLNDTLTAVGAGQSTFGMTEAQYAEREAAIVHLYHHGENAGWARIQATRRSACRCDRAGNALGSMRDLADVTAALMEGTVSPIGETARAELATPQFEGYDPHFEMSLGYGLGLMTDVRWAFGEQWSAASFGHIGASFVGVLADPKHSVVATMFLNGRISAGSPAANIRAAVPRFSEAAAAIAADLGLGTG